MKRLSPVAVLGCLAFASACDSPRRGHTIRVAGDCVEGRTVTCSCPNGLTGMQTCNTNQRFGPCECPELPDAGEGADASLDDRGSRDGSTLPDAGMPFDSGRPDTGEPFDSGVPPDTGVPFDSGVPPDTGVPFDSGVPPDTGVPFDSGVPPDTGVSPDAGGFPDSGLPPEGTPCVTDNDCLPPILVCNNGSCEFGICLDDSMCNPPFTICGLLVCELGCVDPSVTCTSGTVCNTSTGRCE